MNNWNELQEKNKKQMKFKVHKVHKMNLFALRNREFQEALFPVESAAGCFTTFSASSLHCVAW
jgi:hypothetical protein